VTYIRTNWFVLVRVCNFNSSDRAVPTIGTATASPLTAIPSLCVTQHTARLTAVAFLRSMRMYQRVNKRSNVSQNTRTLESERMPSLAHTATSNARTVPHVSHTSSQHMLTTHLVRKSAHARLDLKVSQLGIGATRDEALERLESLGHRAGQTQTSVPCKAAFVSVYA
jgi:hypothetical protein